MGAHFTLAHTFQGFAKRQSGPLRRALAQIQFISNIRPATRAHILGKKREKNYNYRHHCKHPLLGALAALLFSSLLVSYPPARGAGHDRIRSASVPMHLQDIHVTLLADFVGTKK